MEDNSQVALSLKPIGVIHSPYTCAEDMPIQGRFRPEVRGEIEVFKEYEEGLKDIEGFSHLIILYWFHRAGKPSRLVRPYLDATPHGIFATRYPARPNPIGLSVVRLLGREGNILHIAEVDVLDETPLLDIKPYVPQFDRREASSIGWLTGRV
ncbi:MAG: tRNA (N6-threonylcarbamoyladenosine(37)-N6)-methyltransferase TrmO [Chloroflexota bacterium]|nr:tRNA (N6-threonylcarbamoyladenosine(37)-N6)-methyltransferase TrmO [Chloroflexota bacterium]